MRRCFLDNAKFSDVIIKRIHTKFCCVYPILNPITTGCDGVLLFSPVNQQHCNRNLSSFRRDAENKLVPRTRKRGHTHALGSATSGARECWFGRPWVLVVTLTFFGTREGRKAIF